MRILTIIFVLIVPSMMSFAREKIYVDNQEIQQYKGELGKWINVASTANLTYLVQKFDVTAAKVKEANGNSISLKNYIFVPYSEKYIKDLEEKGITRSFIEGTDNDFIWPLGYVDIISSPFGMRCGQLHTGADMPAPKGTAIIAAMDGRVVFSGYIGGHGKSIYLEHRDYFFTRYSHTSEILVKDGDLVKKGQVIGLVGSSGRSTGNHLHFEIRYKDIPLNPLDFLPFNKFLKNAHFLKSWK